MEVAKFTIYGTTLRKVFHNIKKHVSGVSGIVYNITEDNHSCQNTIMCYDITYCN